MRQLLPLRSSSASHSHARQRSRTFLSARPRVLCQPFLLPPLPFILLLDLNTLHILPVAGSNATIVPLFERYFLLGRPLSSYSSSPIDTGFVSASIISASVIPLSAALAFACAVMSPSRLFMSLPPWSVIPRRCEAATYPFRSEDILISSLCADTAATAWPLSIGVAPLFAFLSGRTLMALPSLP